MLTSLSKPPALPIYDNRDTSGDKMPGYMRRSQATKKNVSLYPSGSNKQNHQKASLESGKKMKVRPATASHDLASITETSPSKALASSFQSQPTRMATTGAGPVLKTMQAKMKRCYCYCIFLFLFVIMIFPFSSHLFLPHVSWPPCPSAWHRWPPQGVPPRTRFPSPCAA